MYKPILLSLLFSTAALSSQIEQGVVKRVYSHLMVHDPLSARLTAQQGMLLFPKSQLIQIALIRALCASGAEVEALEEWKKVAGQLDKESERRRLLEMISWGVLYKGDASSQFVIRLHALVGASLTKDAKALPIILEELKSSNALLRAIAVHQAAAFGDAKLRDAVRALLKTEKVWFVRLELMKAAGMLRMKELAPTLKEILAHSKALAEEKEVAIVSLVMMYDSIDKEELGQLLKSHRSGLRRLACEIILHLNLKEEASSLLPLLKDTSSDVRMAALNCFGLLGLQGTPLLQKITPLLQDPDPSVAITASWLALVWKEAQGGKQLLEWLHHDDPDVRRLASAALSASGSFGAQWMERGFEETDDPYVRINLSMGLIGQRKQVDRACLALYEALTQENELWMWDRHTNPLFRTLAPSRLKHREGVPQYPKLVDQMTRLDLLSVLSVLRFPKAQEAVKGFLQHQSFGVTATAITTLLEEGDDESLELVRNLLGDKDPHIRVQAALIVGLLGKDPAAVAVLQEAYPSLSRDQKIDVLEALSRIGHPDSIPFLVSRLEEPFAILRVVAASALIQCLYH